MNNTQFLFNLIHGLNQSEKRFFRLFANLHNNKQNKKYIILYDLILKTKEFNEKIINKNINKHFNKKQISAINKTLAQQILDSLLIYHKDNLPIYKHTADLSKAILLINRKHYQEARSLLKKQTKEIKEKEYYQLSYETQTKNIYIDSILNHRDPNFFERTEQSYDLLLDNLEQLQEIVKARKVHNQIRTLVYNKYIPAKEQYEKITAIHQNISRRIETKDIKSNEAKFYYYQTLAMCYSSFNNNTEKYILYLEKSLVLLKKYPFLFPKNTAYISLVNIASLYIINSEHAKFHQTRIELEAIILNSEPPYQATISYWKHLRLLEYHETFIVELKKEQLQDIYHFIDHTPTISKEQKTGLSFALARYFFASTNYTQSQKILTNVLEITLTNDMGYYYVSIRIMHTLCFYELSIPNLAAREILSLRRKLKREEMDLPVLNNLLNLISLIINAHTENTKKIEAKLHEITTLFDANAENKFFIQKLVFVKQWAEKKLA